MRRLPILLFFMAVCGALCQSLTISYQWEGAWALDGHCDASVCACWEKEFTLTALDNIVLPRLERHSSITSGRGRGTPVIVSRNLQWSGVWNYRGTIKPGVFNMNNVTNTTATWCGAPLVVSSICLTIQSVNDTNGSSSFVMDIISSVSSRCNDRARLRPRPPDPSPPDPDSPTNDDASGLFWLLYTLPLGAFFLCLVVTVETRRRARNRERLEAIGWEPDIAERFTRINSDIDEEKNEHNSSSSDEDELILSQEKKEVRIFTPSPLVPAIRADEELYTQHTTII